jgi:hypothetical protein
MTKKFEPTDEQRELVELLVAVGITQENICRLVKRPTIVSKNGDSQRVRVLVPIDEKTLRRAFREEIASGAIKANLEVGKTLLRMAKSGKHPAMTIFWAKTRMGFRETGVMQTQQLDKNGNPIDPPKPGSGQLFCVFPDGGPGRGFANEATQVDKDADELLSIESSPPPATRGRLNG